VIPCAISSRFATNASTKALISPARSATPRSRQAACAARARSTARATSSIEASGRST
jgi:hypothetical protein